MLTIYADGPESDQPHLFFSSDASLLNRVPGYLSAGKLIADRHKLAWYPAKPGVLRVAYDTSAISYSDLEQVNRHLPEEGERRAVFLTQAGAEGMALWQVQIAISGYPELIAAIISPIVPEINSPNFYSAMGIGVPLMPPLPRQENVVEGSLRPTILQHTQSPVVHSSAVLVTVSPSM